MHHQAQFLFEFYVWINGGCFLQTDFFDLVFISLHFGLSRVFWVSVVSQNKIWQLLEIQQTPEDSWRIHQPKHEIQTTKTKKLVWGKPYQMLQTWLHKFCIYKSFHSEFSWFYIWPSYTRASIFYLCISKLNSITSYYNDLNFYVNQEVNYLIQYKRILK